MYIYTHIHTYVYIYTYTYICRNTLHVVHKALQPNPCVYVPCSIVVPEDKREGRESE